jgi:uncharacterized protein (DUF433 family)
MTDQQAGHIVTDPDVVHGQARVRGTRIPVSVILDCLAAGLSEDEILGQYPTLTVEGVRAAAVYGAALAREEIPPAARVRIKLDENLPHDLATALRRQGHDVHTVVEESSLAKVIRWSWRRQRMRAGFWPPSTAGSVTCGASHPAVMPGSSSFDRLRRTQTASLALIRRLARTLPLDGTPQLRGHGRATQGQDPATRPGRPLVIPEDALDEIRRWADRRAPEHARDQVRLAVAVTDRTVTSSSAVRRRGPSTARTGHFPIARLRYTKSRNRWPLYWPDRNLKFHEYDLAEASPGIQDLLDGDRPRPSQHLLGLNPYRAADPTCSTVRITVHSPRPTGDSLTSPCSRGPPQPAPPRESGSPWGRRRG